MVHLESCAFVLGCPTKHSINTCNTSKLLPILVPVDFLRHRTPILNHAYAAG